MSNSKVDVPSLRKNHKAKLCIEIVSINILFAKNGYFSRADIFDNLARSILGDLARDLAGSDHLQFCIAKDFFVPGCQITCKIFPSNFELLT